MEEFITKAKTLTEALPYLQKYRGKTFVFKYGGHAMSDDRLRESFLRDVILLQCVGIKPVIVHGGGPQIEETLQSMGVKSRFVNGLRVTDRQTMDVVEMVLVGKVNGQLVNLIHKMDGSAVGFSGTDGNLIQARKLPLQKVKDEHGKITEVDLGFVGQIEKINPNLIVQLLDKEQFIPVISPIGITDDGTSLNINADIAACEIAKAIKAEKLMLLTDVKGVLDENKALQSNLSIADVNRLIERGVIHGGMIPKTQSAVDAVQHGVGAVTIMDGKLDHAVLLEIFTDTGVGTLIHA